MTTEMAPAQIAATFGVGYEPPEWPTTSDPIITPERFGKDHYSTLLYVETVAVDHKGLLDHDRMRCDGVRHPLLLTGKRRTIAFGTSQADAHGKYPTRLRRRPDGTANELPDHDDYDCLDDMLACGWLTVTMPEADHGADVFRDVRGKAISAASGEPPVAPSFYTGLDELILARHARWGLTDLGHTVAAALRKHQANGGTLATFEPPTQGDQR